ncbi:MAG: adenosinetriphosphatase [Blautia sp.]|nr:adenosinetriphosphatase [Blautia sp.]
MPNYYKKRRKKKNSAEHRIQQYILDKIPESYADLYPTARQMKRHFIIHCGGTNSGKTYESLKALEKAKRGIYLGPLRLLAFECFERLNESGVPCSLITGEEEKLVPGSFHQASTIEMMDPDEIHDVGVIDEAQMIADTQRGGNWTAAILGLPAKEIHVCTAGYALKIIEKLIDYCNDSYEVVEHERKIPLVVQRKSFEFPTNVEEKDALIVFSKKSVLAVASELQQKGIRASIIYGALPYEVRQQEMHRFLRGETQVVAATDAIGMGLNLPVRRIVFLESMKYDGRSKRPLLPEEIQQIGGRAGRYGIYNKGFVSSSYERKRIRACLRSTVPDITQAILPFPESLLDLEGKLSAIMEKWNEIPETGFFVKGDIRREIRLCKDLEEYTDDKALIYAFITIPYDEEKPVLRAIWQDMFLDELEGRVESFAFEYDHIPRPFAANLQDLEFIYEKCDLIYYFCRTFHHEDCMPNLEEARKEICKNIIRILSEQKLPGKRCSSCGKELPWNYPYGVCEKCYAMRRNSFTKRRGSYENQW